LKSLKHKVSNNTPLETDEQIAFVEWFRLQFPHLRIVAIPNGLRTSIRQAVKAKREGVAKGFPDTFIPSLNIYIEMKRQKGGSVSPEQKDWHHYLEEHCSAKVIVAKGCQDAVNQLMEYLTQSNKG
jgi:hypothetical protein